MSTTAKDGEKKILSIMHNGLTASLIQQSIDVTGIQLHQ